MSRSVVVDVVRSSFFSCFTTMLEYSFRFFLLRLRWMQLDDAPGRERRRERERAEGGKKNINSAHFCKSSIDI